jgi:hypothetical protein
MKAVVLIVLAAGFYVIDARYADGRSTAAALDKFRDTARAINRHTDDLLKLLKAEPG